MKSIPFLRSSAAVLLWLGCACASRAQTDEIQVYDAEIAAPGVFNLTWHNNYTFSGSDTPSFPGAVVPDKSLNGVDRMGLWSRAVVRGRIVFSAVFVHARQRRALQRLQIARPVRRRRTRPIAMSFTASISNSATTPHTGTNAVTALKSARSSALTSADSTSSSIPSWTTPTGASPAWNSCLLRA